MKFIKVNSSLKPNEINIIIIIIYLFIFLLLTIYDIFYIRLVFLISNNLISWKKLSQKIMYADYKTFSFRLKFYFFSGTVGICLPIIMGY